MKARLAAAGLIHGTARPGPASPAAGGGEPASARVAQARSWARERGDRQRQALRPLGLVFLAVVVTASVQTHPAPALRGAGLRSVCGPVDSAAKAKNMMSAAPAAA